MNLKELSVRYLTTLSISEITLCRRWMDKEHWWNDTDK